jgi:hypothetical protein
MNHVVVSKGSALYQCSQNSKAEFICGACQQSLLGSRPQTGERCQCGAKIEEAMTTFARGKNAKL